MNRKVIAIIWVLIIALSLIGCSSSGSKSDTIKIGHISAHTGPAALWGITEKNSVIMEVERINAAGGILGKQIELIGYDTKADQVEAVNVTKRVIADGVSVIIGPAQSGLAIAIGPVTEKAGIPFIATTATNSKVTVDEVTGKVFNTAFRACFIDSFQGEVAAKYSYNSLNIRTAAIVYDVGSDYSQGLSEYFKEEFIKLGGTIVAEEAYRSGELDFRAILGKVKEKEPDLIFAPSSTNEGGLIMKQARDLGLTCKFFGGDNWGTEDLYKIGGLSTEGAYFTDLVSKEDPQIQSYIKEYTDKFGTTPLMPNGVMAIDALRTIAYAMEQGNSAEPDKLIQQLNKVVDAPVLTGKMTIDPKTHNPLNKPVVIMTVENSSFKFVDRVEE